MKVFLCFVTLFAAANAGFLNLEDGHNSIQDDHGYGNGQSNGPHQVIRLIHFNGGGHDHGHGGHDHGNGGHGLGHGGHDGGQVYRVHVVSEGGSDGHAHQVEHTAPQVIHVVHQQAQGQAQAAHSVENSAPRVINVIHQQGPELQAAHGAHAAPVINVVHSHALQSSPVISSQPLAHQPSTNVIIRDHGFAAQSLSHSVGIPAPSLSYQAPLPLQSLPLQSSQSVSIPSSEYLPPSA